jgi:hypothetical protein
MLGRGRVRGDLFCDLDTGRPRSPKPHRFAAPPGASNGSVTYVTDTPTTTNSAVSMLGGFVSTTSPTASVSEVISGDTLFDTRVCLTAEHGRR